MKESKGPFLDIAKKMGTRTFDIEEIVLDHSNLEEIPPKSLSYFPNLQSLYVPFNKLKTLSNLESNTRLKSIDARNNMIEKIDIHKQVFVTELCLSNNNLQNLDYFISTIAHLKDLEVLDLRGNLLTMEKGYRQKLSSLFASLKILDGLEVTRKKPHYLREDIPPITKTRAKSVVDYLKTSPTSEADAMVQKKAKNIKKILKEKKEKEENEMTSEMKKRKEEFEKAAQVKVAPMPDELLLLELKSSRFQKPEQKIDNKKGTRRFIKTMTFADNDYLVPEDETFIKMNPNVSQISCNRKIQNSEMVYK